jgi:hypothetical protein
MKHLFFALLLAIGGPAIAAEPLFGDWAAEGVEHGQHVQMVHHYHSDGTFTADFTSIANCKVDATWQEAGTWHQEGEIIVQSTERVGGKPAGPFLDRYQIVSPVTDNFSMFDPETGITWIQRRVRPDYTFPSIDGCLTS